MQLNSLNQSTKPTQQANNNLLLRQTAQLLGEYNKYLPSVDRTQHILIVDKRRHFISATCEPAFVVSIPQPIKPTCYKDPRTPSSHFPTPAYSPLESYHRSALSFVAGPTPPLSSSLTTNTTSYPPTQPPTTTMSAARMLKHAGKTSSLSIRNTVSRSFHETDRRPAIVMPAMSPFMMDGTITKWVKQEGESFETGDVLLQIESEIAVIDVQATHPGIIGKILTPEGATHVPVSKVIALVATTKEELEKLMLATPPSSPLPAATPSRPSFPAVRSEPIPRAATPHSLHTVVHRNLRNSSFMAPPASPTLAELPALGMHTIASNLEQHNRNAAAAAAAHTPPAPSSIRTHARAASYAFGASNESAEFARAGLDIRRQVVANMRGKAFEDCFDAVL